jgi:predicted ATPase
MAILARIHELVRHRSQFIIATHSPILLAYPDAQIYGLFGDRIEELAYEQTEHYQLTRNFLNHYQSALDELLK